MTSKIRVKVGAVELEFEGSEDYMRQELPALIELLNTLTPELEDMPEEESEVLEASVDPTKQKLQMTTNTIAAKLDMKTGVDLAFAACAHLTLVKGADTFTRSNIHGEMKLASNYYKKTYSNNFSSSLKSIVKSGKLLETAQDKYALEARAKRELETKLSGS